MKHENNLDCTSCKNKAASVKTLPILSLDVFIEQSGFVKQPPLDGCAEQIEPEVELIGSRLTMFGKIDAQVDECYADEND